MREGGTYGRYLLVALPINLTPDRSQREKPNISVQKADQGRGLAATYYPGETDMSTGSMIEMKPGQDLTNFNIQLKEVPVYRVRGRVVISSSDVSLGNIRLGILPIDVAAGARILAVPHLEDGSFEFAGVAAGSYVLVAFNRNGGGAASGATVKFTVTDRDVDGVVLRIPPSFTIRGTVAIDGDAASQSTESDQATPDSQGGTGGSAEQRATHTRRSSAKRLGSGQTRDANVASLSDIPVDLSTYSIRLYAADGLPVNPPTAKPDNDGLFELANVLPIAYTLSNSGTPTGTYLKSVRLDREEVLGKVMDFSATVPKSLTLQLGTDGALLSGGVTKDDKPFDGATVALVPIDPQCRRYPFIRTTSSIENGGFRFESVRPGKYYVFAWESVEYGSWEDSDLYRAIEGRGMKVDLDPKASIVVSVRVLPQRE